MQKVRYPRIGSAAVLCLMAAAAAWGQTLELTAAHGNPPGEPCYEAFKLMTERFAAGKSGLRLKVFPRGQIGDEKDAIEQIRLGALDMSCVSSTNLAAWAPSVGVFDIPFLFRDGDKHPWVVADGPIGQKMNATVEKESGFVVVGWWSAGMRHVFTRGKPVRTPADLKDVKIRVIASPLYIDTFNTLGARSTPMPYSEVYTSLATGAVDAAENDSSGYRNMKFFEQAPQLSLTGHFFQFKPVIANKNMFSKMTPEQRKEFDAVFAEMTTYQRKLFATNFDDDIAWLVKNGKVTVTQPDRASFEVMVKPVRDKYEQKFGRDAVEAIRNAK